MRNACIKRASLTLGLVLGLGLIGSASGQSIEDYNQIRSFTLPGSGSALFNDLPDGRLLVVDGVNVSVETGVGTGVFTDVGTYSVTAPTFGPTLAAISPDGSRVAIGSNGGGSVFVADTASPTPGTTQTFAASDFAAVWLDNTTLVLSNSNGVDVLDTATGTVTNIINNIGGASAGITIDAAGNLYTGNGFDFSAGVGSGTGSIKAFDASAVQAAITSGTPIDFENSGVEVADLLSAGTIGFDALGNFFVGGGDFFGGSGDFGYAALVDADALAARLADPANVPLIDANADPSILRMFDSPQAFITGQQPSAWVYNDATGELLLSYFNDPGVSVYAIPEPTTAALLAIGMGLCIRRRRAVV
ncbi:MAG: PEP-CTERM sorting domain-containing protein [Planctomycetota bacterium]